MRYFDQLEPLVADHHEEVPVRRTHLRRRVDVVADALEQQCAEHLDVPTLGDVDVAHHHADVVDLPDQVVSGNRSIRRRADDAAAGTVPPCDFAVGLHGAPLLLGRGRSDVQGTGGVGAREQRLEVGRRAAHAARGREATVHRKVHAGDERGLVGRQVQGGVGNVLRTPKRRTEQALSSNTSREVRLTNRATAAVSIGPGEMAFTRTP